MSDNPSLTHKQEAFVSAYMIDFNVTHAALASNPNLKYPASTGRDMMKSSNVTLAIAKRMTSRMRRASIDADYVLKRLEDIDQLDVIDILDMEGNLLPIRQWPKVWRISISGFDLSKSQNGDAETLLKKIKWPDKVKNLEMIGKHIDVRSWENRTEITGGNGGPIETKSEIVFLPVGSDHE